jgi:hypothetical protein
MEDEESITRKMPRRPTTVLDGPDVSFGAFSQDVFVAQAFSQEEEPVLFCLTGPEACSSASPGPTDKG